MQPKEILIAAAASKIVHKKLMDALRHALEHADKIQSDPESLGDMVDIGFAIREIHDAADDLRKEAKAKLDLVGKMVAMRAAKAHTGEDGIGPIRGSVAVGLPDVKPQPQMPRPGTLQYLTLCHHFGIPDDVAAAGILEPNYVKLGEYVEKITGEGKPFPPGLLGTYPKFTTRFAIRRDVGGKKDREQLLASLEAGARDYVQPLGVSTDEPKETQDRED